MTALSGKGLLLLSGGFDSSVAGLVMKQQKMELDAIHFSLEPVTDKTAEKKCMELARVIGLGRLFVATVGDAFAEIAAKCSHRYYFVLSKRFMLRVAEKIGRRGGYRFIVTGENLGQVSSQTLSNMIVIDSASSMITLRPLLGFDKADIIEMAKKLGTYEISKGPEICDALGPERPSTSAALPTILEEESRFDWEKSMESVVGNIKEAVVSGTKEGGP